MMRALVGLAMVAGCTFEHGIPSQDNGGGAGGGGAGSGSQQDPDQDSDGDGMPDVTDNCTQVGNADQLDHDADDRGDACDGCPHLVDTGKDTDLDGVGDACDPHPTDSGDRIAFFEGFYAAPSWKAVIGGPNTWQAVDGTMRQTSLEAPYQLVRDDNPDLGELFVDARILINAMSTNNALRRSGGLVLSYRDPNHYFFCGLAALAQGAEVNAGEVSTDFFGGARYDYAEGSFPAQLDGEWLTLQARTWTSGSGGTLIECVSHRAGVTGTAVYEAAAGVAGDVGIRTNGTDASFDYVFVVAAPAPSS